MLVNLSARHARGRSETMLHRWFQSPAARRIAAGTLVVCALASVRCGADKVDAPAPRPSTGGVGQCRSMDDYMPALLELVRDPSQPLAGMREVVLELSAIEDQRGKNPVGVLLDTAVGSLLAFAGDEWESPDNRCLPRPPDASENRLCAVRRALDFGVRDQAAADALDRLTPLLVKIAGYMSNNGDGATGEEHYEIIDVLNRSSRAEALCSPANLLEVLDGLVLFFRPTPACFGFGSGDCLAFEALDVLNALVNDESLQEFLDAFESSQAEGKGRAGIQAVGRLLLDAIARMPEDPSYFDEVDRLVHQLLVPFLESSEKYGGLKETLLDGVDLLRDLAEPEPRGRILRPLKGVARCLTIVDESMEIVGALYDLLARPGDEDGVDLVQLVAVIDEIVRLDRDGVLLGAIHTILATTRGDEMAMDAVRLFLVEVLTVDNARRLVPALQTMLERGVVTELVVVLDNLLYGCRPE